MRTLLWIAGTIAFFLVAFWIGFVNHFPGAALSRYLERNLNRDPRYFASIAPAELKWNRLVIPQIRIDGGPGGTPKFLVAFNDTEIPLSFNMLSGATARTTVGGFGSLELFWPWEPGVVRVSAREIRLEAIPALAQLPVKRINGRLEFDGEFTPTDGGLPQGRLRGRLIGVEIGEFAILGLNIGRTRLDEVRFQLSLGRVIQVETFTLQGDVQGQITGSITPRVNRPQASLVNLQVDLAIAPQWIEQLETLGPIVESFLDEGRLRGNLRGTVGKPTFRKSRSRN